MAVPGQRPGDSEFGFAGQEPLDPVTGKPFPVSQGGRYRGTSPHDGQPDGRADPGRIIRR
ncbi:hypothetical protein GCM10010409_33460 [Mycolicibacterium diernhoferi]